MILSRLLVLDSFTEQITESRFLKVGGDVSNETPLLSQRDTSGGCQVKTSLNWFDDLLVAFVLSKQETHTEVQQSLPPIQKGLVLCSRIGLCLSGFCFFSYFLMYNLDPLFFTNS